MQYSVNCVWNIVINIQGRFLHQFQYNTTDLIKQITPWRLIWIKYYKALNKYIYRPNISIKKNIAMINAMIKDISIFFLRKNWASTKL
jgi:hypothetical protein